MNIPAILKPAPPWLRRHLAVKCLLGVFPRSYDQWIEYNRGATAYVDLRDPEVRNVFLKRSFEPDFFAIASAVLVDGGLFFDCGANFGLCTFGLIPSVERGLACHLFEANPNLTRYLEKSRSLFPSVSIKIIEGCLADWPGTSRFQINPEFTGRSHTELGGATILQNVVLDDYLEQNQIERITFLKMDLEGQELSALRGLTKALARGAVAVIYLEVSSELLRRYSIGPEQVVDFLSNNGFRIFYCRDRDLLGRQPTRVRFAHRGLNRLRLAEFEFADDHLQTDLLAIHEPWIDKAESQ
ncbi:MAG TPA: FkbM family methyltransferase [Chthoniobacterales bacterium]|nr:FkbM family methyltransferase [Chthoniobacterales bacterium]